jgi:sugar O-acyltransferase (sialic acid O-acetyltransferase NeuD family)
MADRLQEIVVVGGGGHAAVLVDALRLMGTTTIVGYAALNDGPLSTLGIPWLGTDEARHALAIRGIRQAVLGVGGATSNVNRRHTMELWRDAGFTFVDVVHPRSIMSSGATHGPGLQILAGAAINIGARLGTNVIVNTNATIEHHCEIADHVHVAPGATLCAGVAVGIGSLVGAGAVVIPGVRLGRAVTVGAGSTVIRDVPDESRVGGSPARPLTARQGTRS